MQWILLFKSDTGSQYVRVQLEWSITARWLRALDSNRAGLRLSAQDLLSIYKVEMMVIEVFQWVFLNAPCTVLAQC